VGGVVLGVDSSTQSVKVVVRDRQTGALLGQARQPHPEGTEVDPRVWWAALTGAVSEALDGVVAPVEAVGVAAQQHGMVLLGAAGEVLRNSLLWNDTRSAAAAQALVAAAGAEQWAARTGSVPVAAFTVAKLAWVAEHERAVLSAARAVCLPHDWLTACCRQPGGGSDVRVGPGLTTDRGDASGTGYANPSTGGYDRELLALAIGAGAHTLELPEIVEPQGSAGVVGNGDLAAGRLRGALLSAGTGDNMAAALGVGARTGDVVVSLGTSGTAYAVSARPTHDPTGTVAGFADATGGFLPLVCTLNAARVLDATAHLLSLDQAGLAAAALAAPAGAGGCVLLPYLDGERTPNLPTATGTLTGLTRATMTPPFIARAAVEGMLCGLADAVDALAAQGVDVRRILLIGGAAASPAVREIARTIVTVPVVVPPPGEYVADGAARQAAWALAAGSSAGGTSPPTWPQAQGTSIELAPLPVPAVREQYAHARALLHPQGDVPHPQG